MNAEVAVVAVDGAEDTTLLGSTFTTQQDTAVEVDMKMNEYIEEQLAAKAEAEAKAEGGGRGAGGGGGGGGGLDAEQHSL